MIIIITTGDRVKTCIVDNGDIIFEQNRNIILKSTQVPLCCAECYVYMIAVLHWRRKLGGLKSEVLVIT